MQKQRKTVEKTYKNKQKNAKKNIIFFKLKRISWQKQSLCQSKIKCKRKRQNTKLSKHDKHGIDQKAVIANTTLNKGNEHRTQNHCGTKDKARASRFLHSVEEYES